MVGNRNLVSPSRHDHELSLWDLVLEHLGVLERHEIAVTDHEVVADAILKFLAKARG